MPVTIGEMQVQTTPPPATASASTAQGGTTAPADVKKEIEAALHREALRTRRLWAY